MGRHVPHHLKCLPVFAGSCVARDNENTRVVMRDYNQAAEAYPNYADVHFALGQLYQQAGNLISR